MSITEHLPGGVVVKIKGDVVSVPARKSTLNTIAADAAAAVTLAIVIIFSQCPPARLTSIAEGATLEVV